MTYTPKKKTSRLAAMKKARRPKPPAVIDDALLRILDPDGCPEIQLHKGLFHPWELWWPAKVGGIALLRAYRTKKAATAGANDIAAAIRATKHTEPTVAKISEALRSGLGSPWEKADTIMSEDMRLAMLANPQHEVSRATLEPEPKAERWNPTLLIALVTAVVILAIPIVAWIAYS